MIILWCRYVVSICMGQYFQMCLILDVPNSSESWKKFRMWLSRWRMQERESLRERDQRNVEERGSERKKEIEGEWEKEEREIACSYLHAFDFLPSPLSPLNFDWLRNVENWSSDFPCFLICITTTAAAIKREEKEVEEEVEEEELFDSFLFDPPTFESFLKSSSDMNSQKLAPRFPPPPWPLAQLETFFCWQMLL